MPRSIGACRKASQSYTARLAQTLRPEHVRPKPGIAALVETLAAAPDVTLGLLTGNLEPCARTKLAPLDLNEHFRLRRLRFRR